MEKRFAPLQTIDFSKIGLGDNLMAFAGLHALLENGYDVLVKGAALYVQPFVADIARAIFADYRIEIRPVDFHHPTELISPYLTPAAPKGARQRIDTFFGKDWALNWAQAIDLIKTGNPHPWESLRRSRQLKLSLQEFLVHGRRDWRLASPEYIGLRVWGPLALRLGVHRARFLGFHKRSLTKIRASVRALASDKPGRPRAAIFPSGKSYQAIPPFFCEKLAGMLKSQGVADSRMYVDPKDPWIEGYSSSGIAVAPFESLPDTITTLKNASVLICADSFVSHLAQFVRDDFILLLNRDFRENVVHPGACPILVQEHPECALCEYPSREFYPTCPTNRPYCSAFDSVAILERCNNYISFLSSPTEQP